MTNTTSTKTDKFWDFDFSPQSTQDTDLLEQIGFIPGLKEILILRQVHALEHATVWVLSETANSPVNQTSENSHSKYGRKEANVIYGLEEFRLGTFKCRHK